MNASEFRDLWAQAMGVSKTQTFKTKTSDSHTLTQTPPYYENSDPSERAPKNFVQLARSLLHDQQNKVRF